MRYIILFTIHRQTHIHRYLRLHMPFGFFGPIEFRTKRGTRVTFIAGFITLPLTAWSLWQIFGTSKHDHKIDQGQASTNKLPPPASDVDLSDR